MSVRLLALLIAVLLVAAEGRAEATGPIDVSSTQAKPPPGDQLSWGHSVGNAAARVLTVGTAFRRNGAGVDTVMTVTYGGIPLTRAAAAVSTDGSNKYRAELWYLVAPPSGSDVITISYSSVNGIEAAVGGAQTIFGVRQADPISAVTKGGGESDTPSVVLASGLGEIVVDVLAIKGRGPQIVTPGPNQTELWSNETGNNANTDVIGASSVEPGTPLVTMEWNVTSIEQWAAVAASFLPTGADSDGDGLWDFAEDANLDSDGDPATSPGPDTDGDFLANYLDDDDDGDAIPTIAENPDPNGDGHPRDALDRDRDNQPDYLDLPTIGSSGTILAEQKISDSVGNLLGPLDDNDSFGRDVAAIGDIDGDGTIDVAVGVPSDDDGGSDRGAIYLLALSPDGSVKVEEKISSTTATLSVPLDDWDYFGRSVAAIGDVDGDGVGDIAVGADRDDDGGFDRGAVYILFLHRDGTVKGDQKISSTSGGLTASISNFTTFGRSIAGLGDLNGDGFVDIAVGHPGDADGGFGRGAVHILFLDGNGMVIAEQKISTNSGSLPPVLDDWDGFGSALAAIGDLDGDGATELVVGADRDDDGGNDRGGVHVLFLDPTGFVKSAQKISHLTGGLGAVLDDNDHFGESAAAAGDVDGDGIVDLIVGATNDDDGGNNRGAAYLCFLEAAGTVRDVVKISSTSGGLASPLTDNDNFGSSITSLGDLDGDGTIDLAIGAIDDDDGGNNRGALYVLRTGVGVGLADLVLTKTVSTSTPAPGDTINYSIVVMNNGPDTATGIVVRDSLPAGVTFLSSSATQGSYDDGSAFWTLGSLANGASDTLVIECSVDAIARLRGKEKGPRRRALR